ncbi:ead/Ea22-like family protein [Salmonella enterica]|nr:ead/Ea22-like family protein [Salmonella enterica]EKK6344464.1 ead/Ea22-like family protein [Salmonella enterica]EKK6347544.1 ead/Ea22-like family protein [Salmonella enterica]ELO7819473.1 ead/Ea22-like family protein [Salmonella enterica]ELR6876242.1 ead/Ea22-like family protein [Salmonella enterica]
MTIDKQVLRQIAESVDREEWCVLDNGDADYQVIVSGSLERGATYRSYQPVTNEISNKKIAAFIAAFNPKVALALLNEVEAAEHTAAVDHEAACSLVEENETLKRRIAEQREYYEGVIADGSKRIAELESKNGNLRTIAHEQNELAIRASLDSNNATVEMGRLHKRIAELEAKLETADKLQDSAFRDGLKAGFSYGQTLGSRNQPGMVVAIHIDAGDFVKVKGQVFEVEETDFDDHDVTLWFVGGNALKCSAGCPVEVVSAPVAADIKVKGE